MGPSTAISWLDADDERFDYNVDLTSNVNDRDANWYIAIADVPPEELGGSTVLLANGRTGRFLDGDANGVVDQSIAPKRDDHWHVARIGTEFTFRNIERDRLLHGSAENVDLLGDSSGLGTKWDVTQRGDGTYEVRNLDVGLWLDGDDERHNYNVDLTENVDDADGRWNILVLAAETPPPPPTPTTTPTATATPSPTPTPVAPRPSATPAPTQTPTPSATPAPTQTPTPSATPAPTQTPTPSATPAPTQTPTPTPPGFGTLSFDLFSDNRTPVDPNDDRPIVGGEWQLFDERGEGVIDRNGNTVAGDTNPGAIYEGIPDGTYWLAAVFEGHDQGSFGPLQIVAATTTDLGRLVLRDGTIEDGFSTVSFELYSDNATPADPDDDRPIIGGEWQLFNDAGENVIDRNGQTVAGDTNPGAISEGVPTGTYWLHAVYQGHDERRFGPVEIAGTESDLGRLVLASTTVPDGFATLRFTLYTDNGTPDDPSDDRPIAPNTGGEWQLIDSTGAQVLNRDGFGVTGAAQPSAEAAGIPWGNYWLHAIYNAADERRFGPIEISGELVDLGNLLLAQTFFDDDLDGYANDRDCAPADPLWAAFDDDGNCEFAAWTFCDGLTQVRLTCLPPIADVRTALGKIGPDMIADEFGWEDVNGNPTAVEPSDSIPPVLFSKRHLQSIQYLDTFIPGFEGPDTDGRYLVTTLSDEHTNKAAVQLVETGVFGSESGETDWIAAEFVLSNHAGTARFNHPGGAQLIGNYLFVALEDFTNSTTAATGVFKIEPQLPPSERIQFLYTIASTPTGAVPVSDNHQATAAVTRLSDGTYLLAACVYDKCNVINFYKSSSADLDENTFELVDQWLRSELPGGQPFDAGCGPQNMQFVPQTDGALHLVMFGSTVAGPSCLALSGYDEHLFDYVVSYGPNNATSKYEVSLGSSSRYDVMGTAISDINPFERNLSRHI